MGSGRPVILLQDWSLTSDSRDDQAMALVDFGAIAYSRAGVNMAPAEYADSAGWLGVDVWHAPLRQAGRAGHRALSTADNRAARPT